MGVIAFPYHYGKLVKFPGGAVIDGFEHQVTRRHAGLSACLLKFCHPLDLLGRVSTRDLVHTKAHERGAMFLWPVRCENKDYMILGRVRPRPEAGEGRPGRTYTQLNAAVIQGADWRGRGPEILAAAPRWLKGEPDLEADFKPKEAPPLEIPGLDDPLCPDTASLPALGDPAWTLLRALESLARPTLVGLDAALGDEAAFCLALGQALALLPPGLRILVTACAGFAAPRGEFAIQFVPETLATAPDPTSGYLAQVAERHRCATFADWRHLGREELAHLGETGPLAAWHSPKEARERAAGIFAGLARGLVIEALRGYLAGDLPRCPALPAAPEAADLQQRVVATLTECLREGLTADRPSLTLVRAAGVVAGLAGPAWTRAWAEAARGIQDAAIRADCLLCSVLRSDPGHDEPSRGIGTIPDFAALARILRLAGLIGDYYRAAGLTDPRVLRHAALAARVKALLGRAAQVLRQNPDDLEPLAETLPEAFANHPARSAVQGALRELIPALGLLALGPGEAAQRHHALYGAAGQILAASYTTELPPPEATRERWCEQAPALRPVFLDHCLQTAIAGHTAAACFWANALGCTLLAGLALGDAIGALIGLVKAHPALDARGVGDRLQAPFAELFQRLAAAASSHTGLAIAILDALSIQGLYLAADPGSNALRRALAEAIQAKLFKAVDRSNFRGLGRIVPKATEVLNGIRRSGGLSTLIEFGCDLGHRVLRRLAGLGSHDRHAAIGILTPLEDLMAASPARGWANIVGRGDPKQAGTWELGPVADRTRVPAGPWGGGLSEATQAAAGRYREREADLAETLRRLILSWAQAPTPEPWYPKPRGSDLVKSPIRLRLAQALGFPRCLYFGRLTDWTRGGADHNLVEAGRHAKRQVAPNEPLTFGETPSQERRVMALCGIAVWREQYAHGIPMNRHQILELLKADGASEALTGLQEIVAGGGRRMLQAVGEDMAFLADFFRLDGPQADTTPPGIRKVLLGTNIEADACLPLFLARGVLTASAADLGIAGRFRQALKRPGGVTGPILGPKVELERLDDEALAARLDRLLFGLNLLCLPSEYGRGCSNRAPIQAPQFLAFSLADGQAPRIAGFFTRRGEYAHAFERALSLAGNPELEGWPG